MTDHVILERLHFRELALRFLDGINPQPYRAIVIADAICSYDGDLDEGLPMRHQCHNFVHAAMRIIDRNEPASGEAFSYWIDNWNEKFGA
jgi:hypothetical protein